MIDVISFEKLLEITDEDLDVIKHNIGCVYMDKTLKPETRYTAIAEAFSKIDEWSSFYHSYKEIRDSEIDELNRKNAMLIEKNKELNRENKKLNKRVNRLLNICDKLRGIIGKLNEKLAQQNKSNNNAGNMVQVDLVEMIESLEKAVNIIEANNSSSNMIQVDLVEMAKKLDNIANSYESAIKAAEHKAAMKVFNQRVASGEVKPAKRADISDEEIIEKYNAGVSAYKMSKEIDLTQQAILYRIKRLKEAGRIV